MDLQPTRQLDYLQRTLAIFLSNPTDMSEQFELLINELIKENKQSNKSPKNSPESSSSDSKTDLQLTSNSPLPLPKKRSAPLVANSKPPPSKRLKPSTTKNDDDDDEEEEIIKKKKFPSEEKLSIIEKEVDINEDKDDHDDDIKSKPSESQTNPSSSRDIDEFAIELGLVCSKCMVLTEEKDNRLVECHECHTKYHQKCHKPPVSTADISDPRCLWYCSKCRKSINKRQQSQSLLKETKTNSNLSSLNNKSKMADSTGKKGISTSITDVTAGLFSFKTKSSESTTSDNTTISNPSISSSNSSLTNGTTTKNTNGWASLATGFKEKKTNSEVTTPNSSAISILAELTAMTSSSNTNNTKRSPSSPKSLTSSSSSLNPLLKQSLNGTNTGSLKTTSSSSLSSFKSTKPSSPPVLKPQLSSSSLKSTQKLLPTPKNLQRISSPTPLGRQTSVVKSPPTTTTLTYNRLNSSGSNSSGSNSPSSTTNPNTKIATNFDYEKRIKQMKKMAAEKSLTKKC